MKYVVTGGAGFIGSCVVSYLNSRGIDDIIIVDNILSSEKWRNIISKKFLTYVNKTEFLDMLHNINDIEVIIHMGARSSTTESDFDYLWNNNVEYTKTLWNICKQKEIRFLYASSAATYGDGKKGFDDSYSTEYLPLNRYGYSKYAFDVWSEKQILKNEVPPQYVGFRFFNVYGPNEYHKGNMSSMVYKGYNQIMEKKELALFKSCNESYEDGKQLRDFVYVKDVCKVIEFFLDHPDINGIYNVGTGKAQSFYELASSIFKSLGLSEAIRYIDMPNELRKTYQYYTQANIDKLRKVGYKEKFYSLSEGVFDYVNNYLTKDYNIL